ncbi:hypothetical protein BFP97_16630 [Roseivirga sp. 4D4]|uniref:hypothetical protein n=1 Tax=Roseivirga sp. 4D4 TaxID=1889784 RepID=UPI0008537024|nr:hypothetical protein [Roseivirga sp. 4D4]OEK03047.1 hypothetical protein BFP97_16630 [Roseivirga sp. 4D4]
MKHFLLLLLVLMSGTIVAQTTASSFSPKPGNSRYMIRGYADANFISGEGETSFGNARFVPLFIYKQSDRLLFEGELEFEIEDGEVEMAIEYANFYYQLSPNITVRMGKILVPFGTFFDRLHPSWINKMPTVPLGYGHDGILPTSDLGIELRGAGFLGGMRTNYSLYLTNGPRIEDGEDEAEEVGMIVPESDIDNNKNKAVGGRFGLFPFADQSLELGFSAQSAKLGNEGSELEDVGAFLYAFDWTYVKNISAIGGRLDMRGQLNFVNVDNRIYEVIEDGNLETFDFDNESRTSFYQLAYRPTFGSQFLQNLELVGRYSRMTTPEEAPWESESTQWTFGLNYWVDWRSAIKIAFQSDEVEGGHDSSGLTKTDLFFLQWTIGF